eukprot:scaffold89124_cov20-Tisochrysis_lutea.AAC.1
MAGQARTCSTRTCTTIGGPVSQRDPRIQGCRQSSSLTLQPLHVHTVSNTWRNAHKDLDGKTNVVAVYGKARHEQPPAASAITLAITLHHFSTLPLAVSAIILYHSPTLAPADSTHARMK